MAFTTIDDVRTVTGLTESQVSDDTITVMIAEATKTVCNKVNSPIVRERVDYIDSVRQNQINGTNATFYVKNYKKFLGDRNKDGDVSTDDVIVYLVSSLDVETVATVSSVDVDAGQIVLSSAPASSTQHVYITYDYSDYCQEEGYVDELIQQATLFLASAYAMARRDVGGAGSVKFGNITINKNLSQGFNHFYSQYNDTIKNMNGSIGGYVESSVKI
jgi:hypothetical protein